MDANAYASIDRALSIFGCVVTGGWTGTMTGGSACAVCKHQRRKCEPNCELAAYFPANRMSDFRALHLVFGVANLTKLIKVNATEAGRRRTAETLTWEARWRERDPSEGCYREVVGLHRENAMLRAENAALRRHYVTAFSAYKNVVPGNLVGGGCYNGIIGSRGANANGAAQTMVMGYDDRYLCPAADTGEARSDAIITVIRGDKNNAR